MSKVIERLYPEYAAGCFHKMNARIAFFTRIKTLLPDGGESVLDFGAGRGKFLETESRNVRAITGIADHAELTVFDVDPVVMENVESERRFHGEIGDRLPFEDNTFDLIYAWMVFEHIDDPDFYCRELARVLKPGGWICAATPNKWGYIGIGARLIPNRYHVKLLKFFASTKKEEDTFDTAYKLNTMSSVRRHFPEREFRNCSYFFNPGPAYHAGFVALARFWQLYNWLMPNALLPQLHIFVQKRG